MTPHWSELPPEVDRFLDREVPPEELCVREAEVAAGGDVAARVGARAALIAALSRAGTVTPADEDALAALRVRVTNAMRGDREPGASEASRHPRIRPWTWAAAAAAVLVLGLGLGLLGSSPRDAGAAREALAAADLLRCAPRSCEGVAACGGTAVTSPFRFPLVERRELAVRGCVPDDELAGEQALLYRPGSQEPLGYVAVPDPGAPRGPEIGVTRLGDAVVFDVRIGDTLYYLAVDSGFVDRRGTCAACHGTSRDGEKNPHVLRERPLTAAP